MPLEEPTAVVALDELSDDLASLFEAVEVVEIEAFLLERAHEPLCHAVTLGLADVGGCRADPEPPKLALELMGRVLRAQS